MQTNSKNTNRQARNAATLNTLAARNYNVIYFNGYNELVMHGPMSYADAIDCRNRNYYNAHAERIAIATLATCATIARARRGLFVVECLTTGKFYSQREWSACQALMIRLTSERRTFKVHSANSKRLAWNKQGK